MKAPRFAQICGLTPVGVALPDPLRAAIYPFRYPKALPKLEGEQKATPDGESCLSCLLASLVWLVRETRTGTRCFLGVAKRADGGFSSNSTGRTTQRGGAQGLRWI